MKKSIDAWILVLIPCILWLVVLLSWVIAFSIEYSINLSFVYDVVVSFASLETIIMPIPGIIVSILGIVRSKKDANIPALVVGVIGLLVSIGFGVLSFTSLI